MPDWNPGQYLQYQTERTRPAVDLVRRIPLSAPRRIVDIGCGPGNSTRVLADRYPEASVLGVDCSPAMIEAAGAAHSDLEFRLCDAGGDLSALGGNYDIVFSNACLQWIPDHPRVLPRFMGLLKKGGVLAVQIPYNFSEPIHRIMEEMGVRQPWCRFFSHDHIFYTLTTGEYYDLLSGLSPEVSLWQTTYYHVLPSPEDILRWYRSTGMRPYLDRLPPEEKDPFEQAVLNGIKECYPRQKNGAVLFPFPRLFFTACK